MKDIFMTQDPNGAIIGMHILYAELLRNTNLCNDEIRELLNKEIDIFFNYCSERNIALPEFVYEF